LLCFNTVQSEELPAGTPSQPKTPRPAIFTALLAWRAST
jgi:hypothetical protein